MNVVISEKQKIITLGVIGVLVFLVPLFFLFTRGAHKQYQQERRISVEEEQAREPVGLRALLEKKVEDTPDDTKDTNLSGGEVLEVSIDANDDIVTTSAEVVGGSLPVRLRIPKKSIAAPVIFVGVTTEGAMDTPKGPNEVAWFNLGPRPGEVGSAVFSGHYGWKDNIPAVFDALHTLQKGDKVYVEDENGITITFIVREVRTYGENADATTIFSSSDGKAHLNLITCGGVWNKEKKSYSERTVVFTDKVE